MTTAVATKTEAPFPVSVPAATPQTEPASPPSSAQADFYRPDWWGLKIWVTGALTLTGLIVLDALERLWRWLS